MKTRAVHHTRVQCALLSALVLACLVCGCKPAAPPVQQPEKESKSPTKVAVGVVRAQLMEKTVDLPATIESDETAMLMARVEAYVDEVLVDIGDEVEEGQVLVRLDAPELQQRVSQHRASIKSILAVKQMTLAELKSTQSQNAVSLVEQELKLSVRDRLARLVSTGALESQRLVEAEAALGTANATIEKSKNAIEMVGAKLQKGEAELAVEQGKLDEAKSLTSYLEIKAPFAGIVVRRSVDPGNLVRPGEDDGSLLTIAKVDKLQAVVHATVDIAAQIKVGGDVCFIADDMPGQKFTGQLSRTSGSYDDRTRMMRAEIDFDNPRDPKTGQRRLRAGSYGSAEIVLYSETLPVVPESAVRRGAGGNSVVLVRGGTCVITPVEIAIERDGLVGISSGIEAGDQVVVKNPGSLDSEQTLKETEIDLVTW